MNVNQAGVPDVGLNHEEPGSSGDVATSGYVHKKFKKPATAAQQQSCPGSLPVLKHSALSMVDQSCPVVKPARIWNPLTTNISTYSPAVDADNPVGEQQVGPTDLTLDGPTKRQMAIVPVTPDVRTKRVKRDLYPDSLLQAKSVRELWVNSCLMDKRKFVALNDSAHVTTTPPRSVTCLPPPILAVMPEQPAAPPPTPHPLHSATVQSLPVIPPRVVDIQFHPCNPEGSVIKEILIKSHMNSNFELGRALSAGSVTTPGATRNFVQKSKLEERDSLPHVAGDDRPSKSSTTSEDHVRDHGSGKHVCPRCKIRCKKPSALKKHLRTHSDYRPYTCVHCNFAFKTKGNLTKHLKSKTHHNRCLEINLQPSQSGDVEVNSTANRELVGPSVDATAIAVDEDEGSNTTLSDSDDSSDDSGGGSGSVNSDDSSGLNSTIDVVGFDDSSDSNVAMPPAGEGGEQKSTEAESSCCDGGGVSVTGPPKLAASRVDEIIAVPRNITMNVNDLALASSDPDQADHAAEKSSSMNPLACSVQPSERQESDGTLAAVDWKRSSMEAQIQCVASEAAKIAKISSTPCAPSPSGQTSQKTTPAGVLANAVKLHRDQDIVQTTADGKSRCGLCNKAFAKAAQLRMHINIHYMERPFRCEDCAISFRSRGHLVKHERSAGHFNKVNINQTFGAPSSSNPRPFACSDCMIKFRIHGHLAKHLRSKMHVMKLESLGKLPVGVYAEIERLSMSLNDIDTSDCDQALFSLQNIARTLYAGDKAKLSQLEQLIASQKVDGEDDDDVKDDDDDVEDSVEVDVDGTRVNVEKTESGGVKVEDGAPLNGESSRHSSVKVEQPDTTASPSSAVDSSAVTNSVESNRIAYIAPIKTIVPSTSSTSSSTNHPRTFDVEPTNSDKENQSQSMMSGPTTLILSSALFQPGFRCNLCATVLANLEAFQQHMVSHALLRPHVCSTCDAGFSTVHQLTQHMEMHAHSSGNNDCSATSDIKNITNNSGNGNHAAAAANIGKTEKVAQSESGGY